MNKTLEGIGTNLLVSVLLPAVWITRGERQERVKARLLRILDKGHGRWNSTK